MNIQQKLHRVQALITEAALESGRNANEILLLAVSKQQSVEAIIEVYHQGVTHFGENYVQEALQKINALKEFPICWHFIGPVQSNKTKVIANHFSWVHSIDRLKIAQLLNEHRSTNLEPLNVCLQINLTGEKTKSGISPAEAAELAIAVHKLPHLNLRGLMALPPPQKNQHEQYELFRQLSQLMHSLNHDLRLSMDTLSMGMSDDLAAAIKAGSTIVRIGRAIFGERQRK